MGSPANQNSHGNSQSLQEPSRSYCGAEWGMGAWGVVGAKGFVEQVKGGAWMGIWKAVPMTLAWVIHFDFQSALQR